MWPLPKIQYEQICINIDEQNATCAWIRITPKKQFALKAYTTIAWNKSAHLLAQELISFIQSHKLDHALLSIGLSAPLIHEQLVRLSTASPSRIDFANSSLQKMLWDYRYLHTLDDGQSLFYVCGASRPLLFAQQLLAQKTHTHLMNITSGYMAQLQAYRTIFGAAFRRSQLALDLIAHNYALDKTISTDSIARILFIDPMLSLDINEHKASLLTMIGLFNQERVL